MREKYLKNVVLMEREFVKLKKRQIKHKSAFAFDDAFYKKCTLRMKDGQSVGEVLKSSHTSGKCYYYALALALALPDAKLVHGNLGNLRYIHESQNYWEHFNHAWVESVNENGEAVIYDTTARAVFNKDAYYKAFDAEVTDVFEHENLADDAVLKELKVHIKNTLPISQKEIENLP